LVFLLLVFSCAAKRSTDVGLGFNETMVGFSADGDMPYEEGYEKGKSEGSILSTILSVSIEHMRAFVKDINHTAIGDGIVIVPGLTPSEGIFVNEGAELRIFDRGVKQHTLELHYFLPFQGIDGKTYSFQGVKYLYGNSCIDLVTMWTTLFVHVRMGQVRGAGKIVQSGITLISDLHMLEMFMTFHFIGDGTDADYLSAAIEFGKFLGKDVWMDCFNVSNWRTDFWYIWGSDGQNGLLLDFIKRPNDLELRLEIYNINAKPKVVKQYLPLSGFSQKME